MTHISISAGSLDRPTGLKVKDHIFLAQKGDYYQVPCAARSRRLETRLVHGAAPSARSSAVAVDHCKKLLGHSPLAASRKRCEFRGNPARDSDLMSATVPI